MLVALDLIDKFVGEIARVRKILEPLEVLQPGRDFGRD